MDYEKDSEGRYNNTTIAHKISDIKLCGIRRKNEIVEIRNYIPNISRLWCNGSTPALGAGRAVQIGQLGPFIWMGRIVWSSASVLKTDRCKSLVGSNPTPSAKIYCKL